MTTTAAAAMAQSPLHQPFVSRIVSMDYYMAPPLPGVDAALSPLEGTPIALVPVIRVFGVTPGGQKACVHLHKAFPYFFIPYDVDDGLPADPEGARLYLRRLALALDAALNASFAPPPQAAGAPANPNNPNNPNRQPRQSRRQVVYNVLLVRARPMYGYCGPNDQLFAKVVLYRPSDVTRAAALLGDGAVLGRRFQPHESHIPYLLQAKIDFNLLGMGWLVLDRVKFRLPLPVGGAEEGGGRGGSVGNGPFPAAAGAAGGAATTTTTDLFPDWPRPMRICGDVEALAEWTASSSQVTPEQAAAAAAAAATAAAATATNATPDGTANPASQDSTFAPPPLLWTDLTVPKGWVWGDSPATREGGGAGGGGLLFPPASSPGGAGGALLPPPPPRASACALELDADVACIANRRSAVRTPLERATPNMQMVDSLVPVWREERERAAAAGVPLTPPPRSPPRAPAPLSLGVTATRAQFVSLAERVRRERAKEVGEEEGGGGLEAAAAAMAPAALTAATAGTPGPAAATVASPGVASPAATAQQPLLTATQAANDTALLVPPPMLLPPSQQQQPSAQQQQQQPQHLTPLATPLGSADGAALAAAAAATAATGTPTLAALGGTPLTEHELAAAEAAAADGGAPLLDARVLSTSLGPGGRRRRRKRRKRRRQEGDGGGGSSQEGDDDEESIDDEEGDEDEHDDALSSGEPSGEPLTGSAEEEEEEGGTPGARDADANPDEDDDALLLRLALEVGGPTPQGDRDEEEELERGYVSCSPLPPDDELRGQGGEEDGGGGGFFSQETEEEEGIEEEEAGDGAAAAAAAPRAPPPSPAVFAQARLGSSPAVTPARIPGGGGGGGGGGGSGNGNRQARSFASGSARRRGGPERASPSALPRGVLALTPTQPTQQVPEEEDDDDADGRRPSARARLFPAPAEGGDADPPPPANKDIPQVDGADDDEEEERHKQQQEQRPARRQPPPQSPMPLPAAATAAIFASPVAGLAQPQQQQQQQPRVVSGLFRRPAAANGAARQQQQQQRQQGGSGSGGAQASGGGDFFSSPLWDVLAEEDALIGTDEPMAEAMEVEEAEAQARADDEQQQQQQQQQRQASSPAGLTFAAPAGARAAAAEMPSPALLMRRPPPPPTQATDEEGGAPSPTEVIDAPSSSSLETPAPPPRRFILLRPRLPPAPSSRPEAIRRALVEAGLPEVVHPSVRYGEASDRPPRPVAFGGREFVIPAADDVPPFVSAPAARLAAAGAAAGAGAAEEAAAAATDVVAAAGRAAAEDAIAVDRERRAAQRPLVGPRRRERPPASACERLKAAVAEERRRREDEAQAAAAAGAGAGMPAPAPSALPPSAAAARWARHAAAGLPQRYRGLLALRSPLRPPSRAEVEAWAAAAAAVARWRARQRQQQDGGLDGALQQDANSGRLLPPAFTNAADAAEAEAYGGESLLQTPQLLSAPPERADDPDAWLPGPSRGGAAAAAADDEATRRLLASAGAKAAAAAAAAAGADEARGASCPSRSPPPPQGGSSAAAAAAAKAAAEAAVEATAAALAAAAAHDQELDYVTPASPKYDERTFFFHEVGAPLRRASETLQQQQQVAAAAAAAASQALAATATGGRAPAAVTAAVVEVTPGEADPLAGPSSSSLPQSSSGRRPTDGATGRPLDASSVEARAAAAAGGHARANNNNQNLGSGITPPSRSADATPPSQAGFKVAAAGGGAGAAAPAAAAPAGGAAPPAAQAAPSSSSPSSSTPGEGLTLLGIEVLAATRSPHLLPDPSHDAVLAVALVAMRDGPGAGGQLPTRVLALMAPGAAATVRAATGGGANADPPPLRPAMDLDALRAAMLHGAVGGTGGRGSGPPPASRQRPLLLEWYGSEEELLLAAAVAVRALDPDVLVGWDLQRASFGYMADRAAVLAVRQHHERQQAAWQMQQQQEQGGGGVAMAAAAAGNGGGGAAAGAPPPPLDASFYRYNHLPVPAAAAAAAAAATTAPPPPIITVPPPRREMLDLLLAMSRTPAVAPDAEGGRAPDAADAGAGRPDAWIARAHAASGGAGRHVPGRIVLNAWRIMRGELKLQSYSREAVAAAVLRERVPHVPPHQLAQWYRAGAAGGRWRALAELARSTALTLRVLDALDVVGRTAELARTFGIDFYSVLTRGSQYRVESLMVRLARSQNLLALSPSRDQVARQPATEALPLVMEPESRFYSDPVVVLDFQSLYPSLVIAYNLCYTTCVGRPAHLAAALDAQRQAAAAVAAEQQGKDASSPEKAAAAAQAHLQHLRTCSSTKGGLRLGVSTYLPPTDAFLPGGPADPRALVVAPNGVAYVPPGDGGTGSGNGSSGGRPGVPGVLPRMLHEILATRVMVKAALKRASRPVDGSSAAAAGGANANATLDRQRQQQQQQRALQRQLNARQFGLKMIANVTYGYTSASFSGRMPCAELADSIVSAGRATLEAAIRLVESHPDWRAKVVYGDTDSLFVLLPGRSRADAFTIGAEIAAAVTASNPRPVQLRMEKVYHPCVLQTKKRYVGAMYEHPSQTKFLFDAKGIETVRRDACPATAKMLESALRVMFATGGDLSRVRRYCERQWLKILAGRVSVQDFVFWREVRGAGGYAGSGSSLPPAAAVAADMARRDPRSEPRPGERVPYVVVCGPPGARLVELAVPPRALVEAGWLALSAAGAGPPPIGYLVDSSSSAAAGGWLSALGASAAGAAAGSGQLRLNAAYYITRQIIPALERVLALAGADVRAWYAALPHAAGGGGGGGGSGGGPGSGGATGGGGGASGSGAAAGVGRMLPQKRPAALLAGMVAAAAAAGGGGGGGGAGQGVVAAAAAAARGGGIDAYYPSRHCVACDELTRPNAPLCDRCRASPQAAAATLEARVAVLRRRYASLVRLCLHCGGGGGEEAACGPGGVVCDSLDCGVFFERRKALQESTTLALLTKRAVDLLDKDELF